MEQLILAVLILVHLFFLPFASPRTGTLGGEREEKDWGESLLQLTIEEGGDLGRGHRKRMESIYTKSPFTGKFLNFRYGPRYGHQLVVPLGLL